MNLIDYDLAMNTVDPATFLIHYDSSKRDDIIAWCDHYGVRIAMDEYRGYLDSQNNFFYMILANFPEDLHVLFELTFKS